MMSSPGLALSMSAAPSVSPRLQITVKPSVSLAAESDEGLSPSTLIDLSSIKLAQTGTFTIVRSHLSVQ